MVHFFTKNWAPFAEGATYSTDEIPTLNGNGRSPDVPVKQSPSDPHTLTDLGNARRLVEAFGENVRHPPELGAWLEWGLTRWREDVTGQVVRYAKSVAERIIDKAHGLNEDKAKAIVKHWVTSRSATRIRAIVDLAATEPGIPVRIEELDCDPMVLNTAAGVVDLRTGDVRPHRREDLMTKQAGDYHPDATPPRGSASYKRCSPATTSSTGSCAAPSASP